jgi:hypothetical protein
VNRLATFYTGLALVVFTLGAASTAAAQDAIDATPTPGQTRNAVAIGSSFDPALTFDLNYARRFTLELGDSERDLTTSFGVSTIPGLTNWDFEGSANMRIWDRRGFDVLAQGGLTLKQLSNAVHRGVGYGYHVGLFPGYFGNRWFVSGELSMRHNFAMSIQHTDAYRDIYADARDGTYALGGVNTFLGVTTGAQIGDHVVLGLRFAWRFQNAFEAYLPYYQPSTFSLQAGYRF